MKACPKGSVSTPSPHHAPSFTSGSVAECGYGVLCERTSDENTERLILTWPCISNEDTGLAGKKGITTSSATTSYAFPRIPSAALAVPRKSIRDLL